MTKRKLRSLLEKYLAGKTTPEESATIDKWYAGADNTPVQQSADQSEIREKLFNSIQSELGRTSSTGIYKSMVFRMAAAACILLMVGIFSWYIIAPVKQPVQQASVSKKISAKTPDIPSPLTVHAVLTLADGRQIKLDSAGNGSLAIQKSAEIIKDKEGQITYKEKGASNVHPEFNTLTVPRGSKIISLTLSDGTLVVLNAESSVTFPTVFTGNTREVSITGEAYFAVARNESMPFFVKHGDVSIKVLGTEFNVNSYTDEKDIAVTLLEGAVTVSNGSSTKSLIPGQQASLSSMHKIEIDVNVDVDEVVAWKNGKFQFGEKADLTSIMRQISRWYDVDVEFQGEINQQFWGSITRSANVSQVLELLEETGRVKFRIEGKKIIVMPVNT